jgi:long-chain acyl-CoA synthetase
VPTYIGGAFEALPRDRRLPKFRQITLVFGCPEPVEALRATGERRTDQERITDAVRQRVIAVGAASATGPATAMPDPPAGQTDSVR